MKKPKNPPPDKDCTMIIFREVDAFRAVLPLPDPAWPVEIRILLKELHAQLFEEGWCIASLRQQCGLLDNNISNHFAQHVGMTIKSYILTHRLELAKRLLRHPELQTVPMTQIAFAVGYASLSAFSTTFKAWVGCSPSAYRKG